MKMPPNYGPDYTRDFEALYARLARELDLPFVPFLLEGVAADPKLNQADGIHPDGRGAAPDRGARRRPPAAAARAPGGAATAP